MDASRVRQRLVQELQEHFDLGKALIALRGPLVKGWLHARCPSCWKGHCRCRRDDKTPWLYASVRLRRGVTQIYVGKPEDQALVRKIQAYGDFRDKLSRTRKLQRQIEAGWKQLEKSLLVDPRK